MPIVAAGPVRAARVRTAVGRRRIVIVRVVRVRTAAGRDVRSSAAGVGSSRRRSVPSGARPSDRRSPAWRRLRVATGLAPKVDGGGSRTADSRGDGSYRGSQAPIGIVRRTTGVVTSEIARRLGRLITIAHATVIVGDRPDRARSDRNPANGERPGGEGTYRDRPPAGGSSGGRGASDRGDRGDHPYRGRAQGEWPERSGGSWTSGERAPRAGRDRADQGSRSSDRPERRTVGAPGRSPAARGQGRTGRHPGSPVRIGGRRRPSAPGSPVPGSPAPGPPAPGPPAGQVRRTRRAARRPRRCERRSCLAHGE